jgi:hypothetical protein
MIVSMETKTKAWKVFWIAVDGVVKAVTNGAVVHARNEISYVAITMVVIVIHAIAVLS